MGPSFIAEFVERWPGKRYFGIYRFVPLFFLMGAAIEFTMINLRIGNTNFYDVYKRKHPELRHQGPTGALATDRAPGDFLQNYQKYLEDKSKAT